MRSNLGKDGRSSYTRRTLRQKPLHHILFAPQKDQKIADNADNAENTKKRHHAKNSKTTEVKTQQSKEPPPKTPHQNTKEKRPVIRSERHLFTPFRVRRDLTKFGAAIALLWDILGAWAGGCC